LEGPSRDEQCVAVTSKSQQSLSKLVNPPLILEIENSICDPTFDEINDIALKVKEATSLLQSSSSSSLSSSTNELPVTGSDSSSSPSSTNSLGWAGTYIGTVISLGFNLNIETSPPSPSNASDEVDNESLLVVKPPVVLAVDTLLGQKIKMREVCDKLNKIRVEQMVERKGGKLDQIELQAFAEALWDKHHQLAKEQKQQQTQPSEKASEMKHEKNNVFQSFGDVSKSSIAWKSLSVKPDRDHCQVEDKWEPLNRATALKHARNARNKLADAMKGMGNIEYACEEALEEANKAVTSIWGTAVSFEVIKTLKKSLVCIIKK
jgi:hypothetical protein